MLKVRDKDSTFRFLVTLHSLSHGLVELDNIIRPDRAQEPDVLAAVEAGHVLKVCLVRTVDLHLAVEPVVEDEVVRHAYAMWLHRVALAVVEVPDVSVVVIAHLLLRRHFLFSFTIQLNEPATISTKQNRGDSTCNQTKTKLYKKNTRISELFINF